MENFKHKDYQFRTEIANTGYKFYSDLGQIGLQGNIPQQIKYLLIESRLSSELIDKLDYSEKCEVLDQ